MSRPEMGRPGYGVQKSEVGQSKSERERGDGLGVQSI